MVGERSNQQTRIAAYCRVSTEKEEQKDSLEHQKEFFTEYAAQNSYTLFRLYADEGISGVKLKKRDAFNRMMNDARYQLFDLVVVKDISRFARNTVDFLQSIRTLKAMGINTIFLTANMTSLGDSEFVLTIFGAMAQEESANLSKRVKWGKKINAQKGRVPTRIYGYDRVDNFHMRINPEEARVIRDMYAMYLAGDGFCKISWALNQRGDKTKFGLDWDPRSIRRLLKNPIYCGHYINHKYEIEDFLTGKQVRLPPEETFSHERPEWAIIPEQTYQAAMAAMEQRGRRYASKSGNPAQTRHSSRYVFSTLIKCEHCGKSFTRKKYAKQHDTAWWVCATNNHDTARGCDNMVKIKESELLEQIRGYLAAMIEDRDGFIRSVLDEAAQAILQKERSLDPAALQKEKTALLSKRSRYQDLYASELLTLDDLKTKISRLEKRLCQVDGELVRAAAGPEQHDTLKNETKKLVEEIEDFLALESVTNADMRKLVEEIRADRNGEIKIILRKFTIAPYKNTPVS